jgi:hypothetical protein
LSGDPQARKNAMDVTIQNVSSSVGATGQITPELVRQIADKVYAMILEELRIEQERRQLDLKGWTGVQGGSGYGNVI